jgi:hypothetical protein
MELVKMVRFTQLDWVAIQSAWTKSDESVRQIGERHGVSHARISQRAKAEKWGERKGGSSVPPKRRAGKLPEQGNGNLPKPLPATVTKALTVAPGVKFPIVIRQWEKNRQEVARVAIDQYKGHETLDCRSWYRDVATGELKPSPKGWTLPLAQAGDLAAAVNDAIAKAKQLGLLKPEEEGQ